MTWYNMSCVVAHLNLFSSNFENAVSTADYFRSWYLKPQKRKKVHFLFHMTAPENISPCTCWIDMFNNWVKTREGVALLSAKPQLFLPQTASGPLTQVRIGNWKKKENTYWVDMVCTWQPICVFLNRRDEDITYKCIYIYTGWQSLTFHLTY